MFSKFPSYLYQKKERRMRDLNTKVFRFYKFWLSLVLRKVLFYRP